DRIFSDKDTFNAAYTIDVGDNVGTGQNPFSLVNNSERAQVLSLSDTHIFSPTMVNNFTAGFSRVWFRYFYSVSVSPAGVQPFVVGKPPGPQIHYRVWMGAWFVQDAMKLRSNLTLSLGLRHEISNGYHANNNLGASYTQGPNGVLLTQPRIGDSLFTQNRAKWLFGPRAALAWDPFGKGQTSVRGGFGMAYNLLDNVGWCCINVPPIAGASQITPGVNPDGTPRPVPFPLQIVPGVTSLASATPGGGRLAIQTDPYTPTVLNYHFEIEQG